MNQEFDQNGFLIVKNFFSKELINTVADYFQLKYQVSKYLKQSKTTLEDDIGESFKYYGDSLCESILLSHGQKIRAILRLELSPSYSFARVYEKGDVLIPHIDRVSCEISATCPIFTWDNKPSTLYISNYSIKDLQNKKFPVTLDEVLSIPNTKVELYPGDVLFYKGIEYIHWRPPLESPYLIQFFMHLIQSNGDYTDYIFDTRPMMGLPSHYKNSKVLDL